MKTTGITLIALGIIMMLFTGFNYVTREKVVDIGDLEIKANMTHRVEWTPIIGGILLVAGMAVLFTKKK
jgi:UDP-N-acetylmuramyl pentapeptide phosphotransferase/UDP-N-acetylglucosamine-1-phosphate transferase